MSKDEDLATVGIEWRDETLPVSRRFDDAYFAYADGRAESAEVFLRGNGLPDRWAHGDGLLIAELGFGTGLNAIETLRTWSANVGVAPDGAILRFTSFEQFPMEADEMARALAPWPDLAAIAGPVLEAWAARDKATASFSIAGANWDITVHLGDANERLHAWAGVADAWFLDGFSPAKNPEMWNEALMQSVANKTAPHGTFSTYTAAGYVRRGLAAAGFEVAKVPGFGGKRERLQGQLKSCAATVSIDESFA